MPKLINVLLRGMSQRGRFHGELRMSRVEAKLQATNTQPCPLCGSEAYFLAWQNSSRQYGTCSSCGLAFVQPFEQGPPLEVGEYPSAVTKPSYLRMMSENAEMRASVARQMAARRVKVYSSILIRSPLSICEVGAGDGAFSVAYSELGISYVGVDINPRIVEEARLLGRNVFCGGPERALDFGIKFDVVFLSQVLEHVLKPLKFLGVIRQLLSDDGVVHIDVPNHDGLSSRIRKLYPRRGEYGFLQPPRHHIAYTSKTLSFLLEKTGFHPLWISPKGNFDKTWGQLTIGPSIAARLALRVTGLIGMGSLLVVLATKKNYTA